MIRGQNVIFCTCFSRKKVLLVVWILDIFFNVVSEVWLVDQSVHFHFQFLKGQSSFAPWRLHCQAKVKVKTQRGERNVFSNVEYNPISSIVTRTYVELEGQMILRLSAVSASAAWPQITGIKSRASHHYQPSNYQPSNYCNQIANCTISLPTMYPFPYQPTKNSDWSICGQRAQWQQWRCFKAVLGQDEEM